MQRKGYRCRISQSCPFCWTVALLGSCGPTICLWGVLSQSTPGLGELEFSWTMHPACPVSVFVSTSVTPLSCLSHLAGVWKTDPLLAVLCSRVGGEVGKLGLGRIAVCCPWVAGQSWFPVHSFWLQPCRQGCSLQDWIVQSLVSDQIKMTLNLTSCLRAMMTPVLQKAKISP